MVLIVSALALMAAVGVVIGRRGSGAGAGRDDSLLQPVID